MSLSQRFNIVPDVIDFSRYRNHREAQHMRQVHDYREMLQAELEDPEAKGLLIPWHKRIKIRPGEVSVWAGINHHGKSTILLQAILWLAGQGAKCMVASFEMPPIKSIVKMFHQFHGKRYESQDQIDVFADFSRDRLWFYEQTRTISKHRVLDLIRFSSDEFGSDQIVIDSLMKCGIPTEDLRGQKEFIDCLCTMAKDYNIHIHLVAHSRKKENDKQVIGKFDIKGASELSDMPDNVFIVWRNEEQLPGNPDGHLIVAKQRHGECWTGKIDTNYHAVSNSFIPYPSSMAIPYPFTNRVEF